MNRMKTVSPRAIVSGALLIAACGSSASSAPAGGDATGASGRCETLAPNPAPALPHVDRGEADARAVKSALDAILAAQSPPMVPVAAGDTIPSLTCSDLATPEDGGLGCAFAIARGAAPAVDVTTPRPSPLAKTLYDALASAGVGACEDIAHGAFERVANLTVDERSLHFDDVSTHAALPEPNLTVEGAPAKDVVDAIAAGGVDDCDGTRTLFLVCNRSGGAPACGASYLPLDDVGGSALLYVCNPRANAKGPTPDAASSKRIWDAILAAAKDRSFAPLTGTLDEATVINARTFRWDGERLSLHLVVDRAVAPPPSH